MPDLPHEFDLGYLGDPPGEQSDPHLGRIFHLPAIRIVVVAEYPAPHDGWVCGLIARQHDGFRGNQMVLPASTLDCAETTIQLDSPDLWALAWQVSAFKHFPDDRLMHPLARLLGEHIRQHATVTVTLDLAAVNLAVQILELHHTQVRAMIDTLEAAGLLTAELPLDHRAWGTFTLTIPIPNQPVAAWEEQRR